MNKPVSPTFATLVQEFFTDYMVQQRALSPRTVASYRDTFVLLLRFAEKQLGKAPVSVQLADINAKFLLHSSITWKASDAILRAAATFDWPRYVRS
jgi:site-specific recombinase XerC